MIQVTSEIGRLRKVLVHEPGLEVDHMVPASMDELLFDDVLFGDRAREEHRLFKRVLQFLGVEVIEANNLLTRTLENPEGRKWILDLLPAELSRALRGRMEESSSKDLARMLTAGVRSEAAHSAVEVQDLFELPPLPNWCFQRDPQIVLGNGVIFGAMAWAARHREALLARAVFRFHPELCEIDVIHDPLEESLAHHLFGEQPLASLEGGDVCVLSPDVVAVGHSERTNRTAIQGLARSLARREEGPRWMVIIELPKRRAYMHLDTVMTQVDHDAALVYPPVICSDGRESARVFTIDLHSRELQPSAGGRVLETLARHGIDLTPIPCGGPDPLHQQRDQWTDGSNALAVAPGVILLYERNVATTEELVRQGFAIVRAEDLVLGRVNADLDAPSRTCVVIPSQELSRARGGTHCLSHPLVRDPV